VINEISPYSLMTKILSVFIILMPAGILMGVPFPLALSFLGRTRPELIPWALAVNGCFSVIAPILAMMFALSAGFKAVMLSGVALYVLAFYSLSRLKQKAG